MADRPAAGGPVPHATHHVAELIVCGSLAIEDPRTLAGFARANARSVGVIRARCDTARMEAKSIVDFTRGLRAVLVASAHSDWALADLFDVADSRTLARLLAESQIEAMVTEGCLTPEEFCRRQTFTKNRLLLGRVLHLLKQALAVKS